MEVANEEIITPSNYIDNIFHSCEEEVAEVPSDCLLLQADVTEETLLHMNILKQDEESSGLCSDHHSYFTSVSAFGDFGSLSDEIASKLENLNASKTTFIEENVENCGNIQEEIVVEDVAEQEVISDIPNCWNSLKKNLNEDYHNWNITDVSTILQHTCNYCGCKFLKKSLLLKHLFVCHLDQPTYECSICGKISLRKKNLIRHLKKHDDKNVEKLQNHLLKDGYSYNNLGNSQKSFSRRFTNISKEFQNPHVAFECYDCGKAFNGKDLPKHLCCNERRNINLAGKFYQCKTCFKVLHDDKAVLHHCCIPSNKIESVSKFHDGVKYEELTIEKPKAPKNARCLDTHVTTHDKMNSVLYLCGKKTYINRMGNDSLEGISEFMCSYCGKRCKDFRGLQKHSSVHSGGEFLICEICKKQFHTRTRLKRHMHSHRNKAVTCMECGEKMPDNRALANHRASRNLVISRNGALTTKIFPCHTCDKVFGSRSSQQIHMRVHTGERPYSCRFCVKAFADGGTLRKHERIHTGEKPYACPVCKKAFNQRVVLREHIKAHHASAYSANDESHKCEVCGTVLNTSQNLFIHLVKHSDDNTAKHRLPIAKPRKYKKWKVTSSKELEKFCCESTETKSSKKINKSESVEEDALIFQNYKNFFPVNQNDVFSPTGYHQPNKVNDMSEFKEIRLFMSENNDCLIPFDSEFDSCKKWKNGEISNQNDIIDCELPSPSVQKLSDNHSGGRSDVSGNDDSRLHLSTIPNNKNLPNDVNNEYDECSSRSKMWFTLKEKYEFSFDSDFCVHSGLGLGATVELRSEF